jgi:DNA polymerase III epsilon subunit
MREIIFDTETTGLDPKNGDRLVEIGCVEMVNRVATGATYHCYFNPQRDMPAEAERVHGLSEAFLADKPLFAEKAGEFLEFIGDAPMVAHNAGFDFGFINAELTAAGLEPVSLDRMVDTVKIARQKHPGAKTRSTLFARAMESIAATVPNTAPCLTRNCWHRSMSNCWAVVRLAWNWPRKPLLLLKQ